MIPLMKVYMNPCVDESLLETIHSGWIGQGKKVDEFEGLLSERFNNNECLALSSGTHGLHLALKLIGVEERDEVITTPFTCTATNWPILMENANIVWADIKKEDLNINPDDVHRKITNKTKAIIIVHWAGYPCDLEELYKIATFHNIALIEDAAHAFGAMYKNSIIGDCRYSNFTMFSFQAVKHLTTIDGGALFTSYDMDYKEGKLLRWFGLDREKIIDTPGDFEDIEDFGYKYHMNDVCATIGISNLNSIDSILEKHKNNANYYRKELKELVLENKTDRISADWIFPLLVENRNNFYKKMQEKGIMVSTSRLNKRNDKFSCTQQFQTDLPVLDKVISKIIHVPCGWWVGQEEREYIVSAIKEGW